MIRELESPEKVAEQIKNGLKTGLGTDSYENAGSPYDKNTSSRPVPENYGSYEKQPKNPAAGGPSESSVWCCLSESRLAFRCWLRCLALALSALVCVALLAVAVAMVMAAGFFCRNRISGCGCCEACSGTRRGSDALRQRLYLPGSRNFAVASPHVGDRKRRSGLLAGDQMALQKDFS